MLLCRPVALLFCCLLLPAPVPTAHAGPRTWHVGPDRALKQPSDAARRAHDGDTVEIDAGVYRNDHATWEQNHLTLHGTGGMAHLTSKGLIPNGKAIWILNGDGVTIENIEFSGAAVRDTNGAGIRHQGGNLVVRNSYFHHNEFSILSGRLPQSDIRIVASRFWHQKREHRFSHGIYIGKARRLALVGCHFTGTDRGHQVKSRALENYIFYNRIEDVRGGNSSRLIDLPNCGLGFVVGNDLHQAASSENFNAIGYGGEGCDGRSARQRQLYVVNNTFVNEAPRGSLTRNFAGGDLLVANNLLFGAGDVIAGGGRAVNNLRLPLDAWTPGSWYPPADSGAVDAAVALPKVGGMALVPAREFAPVIGTRKRPRHGPLDIGSRELAP